MNILECYVSKVYSVTPLVQVTKYTLLTADKEKVLEESEKVEDLVRVDWEYNCYGSITRVNELMPKARWDKIAEQGYDMR